MESAWRQTFVATGAVLALGVLQACSQVASVQEVPVQEAPIPDVLYSTSYEISSDTPIRLDIFPSESGILNWRFNSELDIVTELSSSEGWSVPIDHYFASYPERVIWTSTDTSSFSVHISVLGSGSGRVSVEQYSEITSERDSTAFTHSLLERGVQLRSAGFYKTARPLFERALLIVEDIRDASHLDVGRTMSHLAGLLDDAGDHLQALPLYERALSIYEANLGDEHEDVSTILNNLGKLLTTLGRYEEALPRYNRALEISESMSPPDPIEVATVLNNLGHFFETVGNYSQAESNFNRAIELYEEELGPDSLLTASAVGNLGLLYANTGRYEMAWPLYERALGIRETELGREHPDVAISLNNIASLLDATGRYQEALPKYERALAINENALGPVHHQVATTLSNLGIHLYTTGKYEEALRRYERSLQIRRTIFGSDHPDVATSLNNLALVHQTTGRPYAALAAYEDALETYERAFGPDHPLVATAMGNIAVSLHDLGRLDEAFLRHERVLEIREKVLGDYHPDVALSLFNLATSYESSGMLEEARPRYERSLAIRDSVLGPNHPDIATLLINYPAPVIADRIDNIQRAISILERTGAYPDWLIVAYQIQAGINYGMGFKSEAVASLEEAIELIENFRQSIGSAEDARARYLAAQSEVFDYMISWQLENNAFDLAIEYAERGRSRVMLDQLAAGQIDLRSAIPADILEPLESREKEASQRLASLQKLISATRDRSDIDDERRFLDLDLYADSMRLAQDDYTLVYNSIKSASPLWRSYVTTGGEPVRLRTIQRDLVPENGNILYYQLGSFESYLFVIAGRGNDPAIYPLVITDSLSHVFGVAAGPVTPARIASILSSGDSSGDALPGIMSKLSNRGPLRTRQSADFDKLGPLFELLIPDAAWDTIRTAEEVVIVPDGALFQLPFETLKPSRTEYWLDIGPAIRYAPSLTVLYNVGRRPRTPSTNASLSLSDPVFSLRELEELESSESTREVPDKVFTRDSYERAGGNLARLPGTRRETEAMAASYGAAASQYLTQLSGVNATELNVRNQIAGKKYVHLATHGLVDQNQGALFAALAVTPSIGDADLTNDGFLELHEIYELPLENLELAVLSACETNVGELIEGEGVFALNRGFLAAGARRVIASQWAVDDASTAELIGDFFRTVIQTEQRGERINYTRALWDAKKALRSSENWSDPYYWAPFVLTGLN